MSSISEPFSPQGIPFIRLGEVYDQEGIVEEFKIEKDDCKIEATDQRFKDIEDEVQLAIADESGCQLIIDDENQRYSNFLASPPDVDQLLAAEAEDPESQRILDDYLNQRNPNLSISRFDSPREQQIQIEDLP